MRRVKAALSCGCKSHPATRSGRKQPERCVLHLIKMWLKCAVEETDDRGRKKRTTEARDKKRGIPQGSPISPLLSNLYMRRFVLGWQKLALKQSLGSCIVTYADDLVILCKRGKAEDALQQMQGIMGKLLQCRECQSCLSCARQLHGDAVATVVANQAQGQATQGRDISTLASLRALRSRTPERARTQRGVGVGVKSCPRAGCGKSARPVR